MMRWRRQVKGGFALRAVLVALGVASVGCGGSDHGPMMSGPSGMGTGAATGTAALMSVSPAGGATGVTAGTSITMHFGTGMAAGMEQYVDLHVGDLAGPTVPMACTWSADRTTLVCTPHAPLASHTTYVIHMGGGLMTAGGQNLDFGPYGPGMGGQWIAGGMMGGTHAGSPWGMMGPTWHSPNGSYGMAFPFTTA